MTVRIFDRVRNVTVRLVDKLATVRLCLIMINLLKLLFLVFLSAFAFVDQQILIQSSTVICKTRGKVCLTTMINDGECDAACSGADCDDADYEDCS